MPFDVTDFKTLMQLEPHGPDVFVGVSPSYPWGRVYGGQVVAQALRAACETVDDAFQVHSLHSYFIRGGDYDEPIRYEVDRIRNGRSFLTRRVVARQSMGPILNLSVSFQIKEGTVDVQCMSSDHFGQKNDFSKRRFSVPAQATLSGSNPRSAISLLNSRDLPTCYLAGVAETQL
jgi:acyl-CoA thioesterase